MATQPKTQVRRIDIDEVRRIKELVFVDAGSATPLA